MHTQLPIHEADDYYGMLGVSRDGTENEIKEAHHKLAKKYHPNKNPEDEEKFKKINEAYKILSDKELKPLYDQYLDKFDHKAFIEDKELSGHNIQELEKQLKIRLDRIKTTECNLTAAQKAQQVVDFLKKGDCKIVESLLQHNHISMDEILKVSADPNKGKGYTILHWAAQNNRFDIFKVLKPWLNKKLINQFDNRGSAPFHHAVYNNNIKLVENLLETFGVDINVLNGFGYNSLAYAREKENVEMILLLVDLGIDIKSENSKEILTEIILWFAKGGDSKSLETLLSHKSLRKVIDINGHGYACGYYNITILEVAAFQNDIEMLKMLAKYQPNPNLKSINECHKGKAILHLIAEKHSNSKDRSKKAKMKDVMILLILLFNADLTLKDNEGKKPLDYLNDRKLKKYLEEDVVKLKDDDINKAYVSKNLDRNDPSTSLDAMEAEKSGKRCTIM